ncbi:MAG: putative membrane-bound dehydrogenase-like protein, partial [Rhodothermales bacterium]
PSFNSKPMGISVFDNVIVVSMAPNIHVYTDINRDDVFDPEVDSETIIAKGFHGSSHDHALHAVVPGPSGKWYVNHGNIGADVTMADGREIHASSYYSHNPASIGKTSFDGRLYVGGFALRMDPNGHNAEVIFQNGRNTHAMLVTSFGDILQADNDDPAHARAAWVMEYSNFGYACLEDGNRSWEDSAKSWEKKTVTPEIMKSAYERHSKASLRRDEGHWRQHFPGVTPPGNLWGPGAPTGDYFIEGDELGVAYRGRYLVCETVHRAVFSFRAELRDAQVELVDLDKAFFATDRKSKNSSASGFLPSDVVANTDGSLFVSDWNSHVNGRGSGNAEGAIFRLSRTDEKAVSLPQIDFASTAGLLAALKSPAPGVRWVAQDRLKKSPDAATALAEFASMHADNPYYHARAVFALAQLDDPKAQDYVRQQLKSANPQARIVAFRALRLAEKEPVLPHIRTLAKDGSPAVRREALHALRNVDLEKAARPLAEFIAGYDGKNRWYLEAIGAVCDGRSAEVYDRIVRPGQSDPSSWNERQKNLAWRLRSPRALDDLAECMLAQNVDADEFRRLAYTFGLCYSADERTRNAAFMDRFSRHPAFKDEAYQLTIREFLEKDIHDPPPVALTQSYVFPKSFGTPTEIAPAEEIAKLTPNLDNGQAKAALCLMCHTIGDIGVAFGPNLSNWGQVRDLPTVLRALMTPSSELAHGYDKPLVVTQKGHRLEGVSRGYSWHAGAIRVKTMGGITLKVPHRRPGANIQYLKNHSWMPSASAMGLSSQDVRDIAAYLMSNAISAPKIVPTFSRGTGPGWVELGEADFVNVNCRPDTWRWEGNHAWCTGQPTGVIRYREPLTNFELSCEWMHKQKGGNSGVFVWATPSSIIKLAQGKGRLPHGIEVQVLDLGYREVYEARYKKPSDWFTSHGDVFPVGPVKMKPFPPVAPNGRRSFPSKETTLGINQWNHYYVRAIDGEVRLWVNGTEVSGGDSISPAFGFLCLESEGAPVEFKKIRLRQLPPYESPIPPGLKIPIPAPAGPTGISLKGHALLGTWAYFGSHTREFLADGRCILRNGSEVIWAKPAIFSTPDSITLDGGYNHTLKGDTLHIEGRYQATRE